MFFSFAQFIQLLFRSHYKLQYLMLITILFLVRHRNLLLGNLILTYFYFKKGKVFSEWTKGWSLEGLYLSCTSEDSLTCHKLLLLRRLKYRLTLTRQIHTIAAEQSIESHPRINKIIICLQKEVWQAVWFQRLFTAVVSYWSYIWQYM